MDSDNCLPEPIEVFLCVANVMTFNSICNYFAKNFPLLIVFVFYFSFSNFSISSGRFFICSSRMTISLALFMRKYDGSLSIL